jgi:hypothetical protein
LTLGLDLRGVLPTSAPASFGGSVVGSLASAIVAGCVRHRVLAVCALAGAGVERGSGIGYDQPRTVDAPWVALGARLAAEVPFARVLALQGLVDVLAPLTRTDLYIGPVDGGRLVYRTPAVASALGVGLVTYYP